LNRPELTAEKFICNPFSREGGARMYRTGDLSKRLRDGRIEFLGRADHQVKIRGFRIELGEIESALALQEGVREAVVLALDDDSGGKRLVAYVAPEQGKRLSISELRRGLREKLPEYMAPSAFAQIEELPLTPNGKVDRKALLSLSVDRPDLGHEYVAPRTPTEELVAAIWRESLRLESVGILDNFFELGGHSLLAAQIVAKVSAAVHTEIPLIAIFEFPTVEGLANAVERAVESETKRPTPVIRKFSREAYRFKASQEQGLEIPEILRKKRLGSGGAQRA
jgi:acyl carrier protein